MEKEMLTMAEQIAARPGPAVGSMRNVTRQTPPEAAPGAGFTLMEVLVAVTILGIGFVALFGVLSGSLAAVSRIEDRETLVRTAQMKMNRGSAWHSGRGGSRTPARGSLAASTAGALRSKQPAATRRKDPGGPTGWPGSGCRSPGRAASPRTAIFWRP